MTLKNSEAGRHFSHFFFSSPFKNVVFSYKYLVQKKNELQSKEKICGHFCFKPSEQTTVTKHNWNKMLLSLELPKHTTQTPGSDSEEQKSR